MRRNVMLPCLLVTGLISVYAFAQSADGEFATDDSAERETNDVDTAEPDATDEAAEESVGEVKALRTQYLKLVNEKADLMDRSALRDEISRTEQNIDELKAGAELAKTRQMLLRLVETYPNTEAATTARHMLQSADNPPSRFDDRGRPTYSGPNKNFFEEPVPPGTTRFPRSEPIDVQEF